jgi:hypothetical protein
MSLPKSKGARKAPVIPISAMILDSYRIANTAAVPTTRKRKVSATTGDMSW